MFAEYQRELFEMHSWLRKWCTGIAWGDSLFCTDINQSVNTGVQG